MQKTSLECEEVKHMFIDMGYVAVFFASLIGYLGYLMGKWKYRDLVETVVNQLIEDGYLKLDEKTDELIPWKEWKK